MKEVFPSLAMEGAEASEPIARGRQEKDPRSLLTERGTQQLYQGLWGRNPNADPSSGP